MSANVSLEIKKVENEDEICCKAPNSNDFQPVIIFLDPSDSTLACKHRRLDNLISGSEYDGDVMTWEISGPPHFCPTVDAINEFLQKNIELFKRAIVGEEAANELIEEALDGYFDLSEEEERFLIERGACEHYSDLSLREQVERFKITQERKELCEQNSGELNKLIGEIRADMQSEGVNIIEDDLLFFVKEIFRRI